MFDNERREILAPYGIEASSPQAAVLAGVPRPSAAHRAQRLWISRKTLLVRYGAAGRLGA